MADDQGIGLKKICFDDLAAVQRLELAIAKNRRDTKYQNMIKTKEESELSTGCELTTDRPSVTWSFEEEEEDTDFLMHTLFLKNAVLGASAVKDERNLVQVETKTFDGGDVKQPIVSLRLGQQDMCLLDISFGHTMSATFRLIEGTGPVCLSAQQLVEFPDEGQADISQDEGEEFYEDEEESPGKTSKGAKKRKAPTQAASKAKKGKISRKKASSEEDSEESEEDDLDDEDEDEDEDMDESEESSPEKNDKKSKKGKAEVTKAAKSSAKKSGKEPRGTPVSAKGKKKK